MTRPNTKSAFATSAVNLDETAFFRTLVENTSDAILTLDTDSTIVFANPGVKRLLGYQPHELVGESKMQLIPERLRDDHFTAFEQYQRTGERNVDWDGAELPALHKDGHEVPVSITLREHTYSGQLLFTGIIRDISERKQREMALRRERNVVEQLIDTSPVGLVVLDRSGEITRANERAAAIYGVSQEELLSQASVASLRNVYDSHGDPIPAADRPFAEVFATGEPVYNWECQLDRPDGKRIWLSINVAPVPSDSSAIEEVIATAEDITDRKERERRLRAFQQAIEHAGHSVYLTGSDGTIEYVNSTFEEQTGYTETDAVGDTPRILNSGEHDKAFYSDLWNTILSGEVWTGEVVNERKSGEQYTANQTIAPVTNEDGDIEHFVAINADVTARKRREQELRNQRNVLERIRQVTDSLHSINPLLMQATTRDEIEQAVCDQLASSEAYTFAWIGDYIVEDREIEPHTWAGIEDDYLSEVDVSAAETGTGRGPTDRAVRSRSVQAVQDIHNDPSFEPWREQALQRGYRSAAAVPLVYRGTIYGVLGVYSARPFAFDDHEQALLAELGERIGHAIHAAENQRLLHSDTRIELTFQTTTDTALIEVSDHIGCRLTVETFTPTSDGAFVCYSSVDEASPERVCERLRQASEIELARPIRATGESGAIECVIADDSPAGRLTEYGATIQSMVVERGEATITGEIAPDANTRRLIKGMQATFPEMEFISKQTVDRPAGGGGGVDRQAVDDVLTERQREVLEIAYHAGFFASPRHSTGEEIAEALDISSPTFYQHVRKATEKLLDVTLADEYSP